MSRRTFIFSAVIIISLGVALITASFNWALLQWAGISLALVVGSSPLWIAWIDRKFSTRDLADGFSDGDSVEVDCRTCGQFNRVPAIRLRDRPRCGRCKTRLMPGRRIVFTRTSSINAKLSAELDALWKDEDLLWRRMADHLATKRRTEEEHDHRHLVN